MTRRKMCGNKQSDTLCAAFLTENSSSESLRHLSDKKEYLNIFSEQAPTDRHRCSPELQPISLCIYTFDHCLASEKGREISIDGVRRCSPIAKVEMGRDERKKVRKEMHKRRDTRTQADTTHAHTSKSAQNALLQE